MILDFNALAEFSRQNCGTICAFLVPMNLIATLQTILFTALGRPGRQTFVMAGFASLYAGIMVAHVWTWFAIGVVMAPTFILLCLGSTCLAVNLWAIAKPAPMIRLLEMGLSVGHNRILRWRNATD
ncbi:hypothetical protein [Lyngbya sp. CCY1209]|jgi:hypothetical protein|uniref:hypothetical protein n=1 Tax=Lyngbya sp. CCY1209 TaxID=2886103 RepID=UPI002D1FC802|nr:hypothetical protein [Lyngbya sp. CCY1209]MEB3883910.1 hypothetical protein [Lyngbya sp. CCY1209]